MARNPAIAEPPGLYAISVTSELSGFTAGTLRLYEQYGLITPARTRTRATAQASTPSAAPGPRMISMRWILSMAQRLGR